jgi:hypothetical protein
LLEATISDTFGIYGGLGSYISRIKRPNPEVGMKTFFSTCALAALLVSISYAGDVSITIYNDNFGLVKQTEELSFKKGTGEVRFDNVAAQIDPTSVHILPKSGGISILEQNYQYDLISTQKIMQKYLGTEISLVTKTGDIRKGILQSFDGNFAILQSSSGEISITNANEIVDYRFGKLPDGLVLKPTLVWWAESDRDTKSDCEVSYLTDGINWHAEYVALVDKDDKNLSLSGWVSIDNQSGATYEDATLKLVAGKVNRVQPPQPQVYGRAMEYDMVAKAAAPQFQEESFFEYHLYSLTRKATVADKETKQLSLFPEASTPVAKVYVVEGQNSWWGGADNKPKIKVNLEFTNSKESGLGMPLPKGKLRTYKADSKGELQFIGEDEIDHTPKDEKVRVFLGEVFDITCERNKINTKDLGPYHKEETYEIKLKNHKDTDVVITVVEPMPGWWEWHITDSNLEYNKVSAYKVEFQVPVKSNGENTLTYTLSYINTY